jgi:hypothetical protein
MVSIFLDKPLSVMGTFDNFWKCELFLDDKLSRLVTNGTDVLYSCLIDKFGTIQQQSLVFRSRLRKYEVFMMSVCLCVCVCVNMRHCEKYDTGVNFLITCSDCFKRK